MHPSRNSVEKCMPGRSSLMRHGRFSNNRHFKTDLFLWILEMKVYGAFRGENKPWIDTNRKLLRQWNRLPLSLYVCLPILYCREGTRLDRDTYNAKSLIKFNCSFKSFSVCLFKTILFLSVFKSSSSCFESRTLSGVCFILVWRSILISSTSSTSAFNLLIRSLVDFMAFLEIFFVLFVTLLVLALLAMAFDCVFSEVFGGITHRRSISFFSAKNHDEWSMLRIESMAASSYRNGLALRKSVITL